VSATEIARGVDAAPVDGVDVVDAAADTDKQANSLLVQGATVAVLGVAGAALGAACPLCVVVAPALLTGGVFQKYRAWRKRQDQNSGGAIA
jgi:hypothetical protein